MMMRKPLNISDIDVDLLALAFSFLDADNRVSASLVCKQWNAATKSHILNNDGKEFYFAMVINAFENDIRSILESSDQSRLEELIRARKFNWYVSSEFDTKEAVLEYMKPRFQHEDSNTCTGNTYFITQSRLDGNKLSVIACEHVNYSSSVIQTFAFSPPLRCDRRGVDVGNCVYDMMNPQFSSERKKFKKWQEIFAKKAKEKEMHEDHQETSLMTEKRDSQLIAPQSVTPQLAPASTLSRSIPSHPRQAYLLSQNPATSFAKPKPEPKPKLQPMDYKAAGSCVLS